MTSLHIYKTNIGTYITSSTQNRILIPELPTNPGMPLEKIDVFLGYKGHLEIRPDQLRQGYGLAAFQLNGLNNFSHLEDSGQIEKVGRLREEDLAKILEHHDRKVQQYASLIAAEETRAEAARSFILQKSQTSSSLIEPPKFKDLLMRAFLSRGHEKSREMAYAVWTDDKRLYVFDENVNLLHPQSLGKPGGTPMYHLEGGEGFPKGKILHFSYRENSAKSKAHLPTLGSFDPITILGVSRIPKQLVCGVIDQFFKLQEYDVWFGNRIKQLKEGELSRLDKILERRIAGIPKPIFQESLADKIKF